MCEACEMEAITLFFHLRFRASGRHREEHGNYFIKKALGLTVYSLVCSAEWMKWL